MATAIQDYDILSGSKVDELIFRLVTDGSLVRVSIPECDDGFLATICEIRPQDEVFEFKLEISTDISGLLEANAAEILIVEFTAKDQLPHRFESKIRRIGPTAVWLLAPERIQRYQFRNNFRIKAPYDAQFNVRIGKTDVHMPIDNISMGGVYCSFSQEHKQLIENTPVLKNAGLVFLRLEDCIEIWVEKAELVRLESVKRPLRLGAAYEFVQMKPVQRKKLRRQIYEFQRDYLKKRVRFS